MAPIPVTSVRELARELGKAEATVRGWLKSDRWPFARSPAWPRESLGAIRAWVAEHAEPKGRSVATAKPLDGWSDEDSPPPAFERRDPMSPDLPDAVFLDGALACCLAESVILQAFGKIEETTTEQEDAMADAANAALIRLYRQRIGAGDHESDGERFVLADPQLLLDLKHGPDGAWCEESHRVRLDAMAKIYEPLARALAVQRGGDPVLGPRGWVTGPTGRPTKKAPNGLTGGA